MTDDRFEPFSWVGHYGSDGAEHTITLRRKRSDGSIVAFDQDGNEVPEAPARFQALNAHVLSCADCQLPQVEPGGAFGVVVLCDEAERLRNQAIGS